MPFFNEPVETSTTKSKKPQSQYDYTLEDCFDRGIPVTSIEFNPPPVSGLEKMEPAYWRNLQEPDEQDRKVLQSLAQKAKHIEHCQASDTFLSITDSAAGVLRMHNLTMIGLLSDPQFTERWLQLEPLVWNPRRIIVHLTRNHNIPWLKKFLRQCRHLGYTQLLLITGDPLKEVRYTPVDAATAMAMDEEEGARHRLKNSVELLKFVREEGPDFFVGAGHNPFLKQTAAEKHLLRKVEAGTRFLITQPVSYYEECWRVMDIFAKFQAEKAIDIPVILGVFNYSVPCGSKGFREEVFQKRYKFWKKLFGFVPDGVRSDYERGLNGIEILARSINKLKQKGYYHFDVMNAERNGARVLQNRQRLTHESDRLAGSFDASVRSQSHIA